MLTPVCCWTIKISLIQRYRSCISSPWIKDSTRRHLQTEICTREPCVIAACCCRFFRRFLPIKDQPNPPIRYFLGWIRTHLTLFQTASEIPRSVSHISLRHPNSSRFFAPTYVPPVPTTIMNANETPVSTLPQRLQPRPSNRNLLSDSEAQLLLQHLRWCLCVIRDSYVYSLVQMASMPSIAARCAPQARLGLFQHRARKTQEPAGGSLPAVVAENSTVRAVE